MPPAIIAAAVAGTAAIGGAAISASATNKASKAATDASNQNAQIQQQQFQQVQQNLSPFMQDGYIANNALMSRFGLAQPAPTSTPTAALPDHAFAVPPGALGNGKTGASTIPAVPQGITTAASLPAYNVTVGAGGGPVSAGGGGGLTSAQIAQIEHDRPDVVAEYDQRRAQAAAGNQDAQSSLAAVGGNSLEGYLSGWYNQIRPQAGDPYQVTATPQTPSVPAPPANGASQIPGQTFTSSDNGGLGDRAALARPTFTEAQPSFNTPTFGPAPTTADYLDPSKFDTSPGYQFRLDQGLRNVNAAYGAKGLLKSDATIKALNDYAQGQASSEYGNWFNQNLSRYGADVGQFNTDRATTLGQFNTDRAAGLAQFNQNRNVFNTNYNTDTARYDTNFNADRGYNTDQYNTYTGNLFNLATMGQNAAAGVGTAGQNYANAMTANNNSRASVQGNAAIAGANGITGALNAGVQAYGMYSNPFSYGYGGGSGTQGTVGQYLAVGGNPANVPPY